MTRFRGRIGETGCELILQATVTAGLHSKTIKPTQLKRREAIEPVIGHLKSEGL